MPQESDEAFEVDLEPTEDYYRRCTTDRIRRDKARTANLLAIILIVGVVLSLPMYLLSIWIAPEGADRFVVVFEKWYAIVSPLAGTALGAYYGSRLERSSQGG